MSPRSANAELNHSDYRLHVTRKEKIKHIRNNKTKLKKKKKGARKKKNVVCLSRAAIMFSLIFHVMRCVSGLSQVAFSLIDGVAKDASRHLTCCFY